MSDYKLSVSIDGDASGMKRAFQIANAAVADFDAKTSGITKKLGSLGSGLTSMGNSLTKNISKPALVAATALKGITLVKGFNRLTDIDDARAKLMGLGHDAQSVDKIMSSALTSVKGTAFGMDEAATTAAGACAAGVKQGKELTRYLSLTADAAAIAGTSMADMGAIVNKVQTSNKAYMDNLNQLADRGLPIYQWLADECHTTTDAITEMASQGQISSAMFLSAIEKNLGGAAKTIGDNSFKASVNNMNAALSRIGANFLDAGSTGGGVFSQLKPLIKDVTGLMETLETQAADWGVAIGKSFEPVAAKAQSLISKFEALDSAQQLNIVKAAGVGTALVAGIGPATTKVGEFITAASKISAVGDSISNHITSGFASIPKSLTHMTSGVMGAAGDIKLIFSGLAKPVAPAFKSLGTLAGKAGSKIATPFKKVAGLIGDRFGDMVGNIGLKVPELYGFLGGMQIRFKSTFAKLSPVLKTFTSNCGVMVQKFGKGMTSLITKSAGFGGTLIKSFMKLTGVGAIVGVVIAGLGLLQKGFGTQINAIISNIQQKAPEIITKFSQTITDNLPNLMANGAMLVKSVINTINQVIPQLFSCGAGIIESLAEGLLSSAPSIVTSVLNLMTNLAATFTNGFKEEGPNFIENIASFFTGALDRIAQRAPGIITNLCAGLTAAIPTLISSAINIIDSLLNTFNSCAPKIITGGADIIVALVQGLADNLPKLIPTALKLIITIVTSLLDNLPKIITAGLNLILALADGLVNAIPQLIQSIPTIIQSLVTAIVNLLPTIIDTGITLITTLATGLLQAIPDLVAAIPEIIQAVKNAFVTVNWGEVGQNILDGIAEGLKSVASNLVDAAKGAAGEALDSVKEFLGIHSPSRVMRDEVGIMMGLGLGIGFEKSIPVKAMGKSIAKSVDELSTASLSLTSGAKLSNMVTPVQSSVQNMAMNYAISTAASTQTAEPVYFNIYNDDIITAMSSQNAKLVNAMLKAASDMKIVADDREVTRYMKKLGFTKVGV